MKKLLLFLIVLVTFSSSADDRIANIDLTTATDAELESRVSTCTLPDSRTNNDPLLPSEITSIEWYTCTDCAVANDSGGEPDSDYSLAHTVIGNNCSWTHNISAFTDGQTQVIRALVKATDGSGGTVESVLSPDRGFLVFAGARPLATPLPATAIQP